MEGIDELLKYVGNNFDKPLLKFLINMLKYLLWK